jgi:hypothetical protein
MIHEIKPEVKNYVTMSMHKDMHRIFSLISMYYIFFVVIGFQGGGGVLRIHINIEDKWL